MTTAAIARMIRSERARPRSPELAELSLRDVYIANLCWSHHSQLLCRVPRQASERESFLDLDLERVVDLLELRQVLLGRLSFRGQVLKEGPLPDVDKQKASDEEPYDEEQSDVRRQGKREPTRSFRAGAMPRIAPPSGAVQSATFAGLVLGKPRRVGHRSIE